MVQTDTKAAYVTATGNAYAGPARVRAIYANLGAGAGLVELTDGSASGTLRLKFDTPASATQNPLYMELPADGIQFTTTVYVKTLTNVTSLTVIYG